jgi:Zn-finger nucleic acid-binding protein
MKRRLDARYPCPVCLGVNLRKTPVGQDGQLVLDHCERCGGVWFEQGEVQALRRVRPQALWSRIAQRPEPHRMACHVCRAPIGRHEPACPACGWQNRLDCPVCQVPMEHASHESIPLDVCRQCKGVWFDHDELAWIWNRALAWALERRGRRPAAAGEGSLFLMEALAYDPFAVMYGAHAAGHVLGAGVQALSHAPDAAGGVIEAAGDVAGGLFETIVEIIGGLF